MTTTISKTFYLEGHTLVFNEVSGTNVSRSEFPLREVTKQELSKLRLVDKAGFVLKKNNKTYYTKLPNKPDFPQISALEGITEKHLCADCPCKTMAKCKKFLKHSRYIENYNFITFGFETFSTYSPKETFVVYTCRSFETSEYKTREEIDISKFNRAKLFLAQMYNPDIDQPSDISDIGDISNIGLLIK